MKELAGRVAVITGAGSGIGRELALGCARARAHVVLADVDEAGMQETAAQIAAITVGEGRTLAVRCDVARADEVEALAARAYAHFGAVHLLCNNAGVAILGPAWSATLEDWQWVMGVNFMGVVHGVRSFVPRMLAQGGEGHVVNTASVAGLISIPWNAIYCASKHAVVTLSECLYHDLRQAGAAIGVSVLCPAFVSTNIADSARHRPAELGATQPLPPAVDAEVRRALRSGRLTAADVAAATLEAVAAERFYVLTHERIKGAIEVRMRDILDGRAPTNTLPPPAPGATGKER